MLELPGYGYRRVTKALHRDGWTLNHKKVLGVMREESLVCQLRRAFRVTTDSKRSFFEISESPNLDYSRKRVFSMNKENSFSGLLSQRGGYSIDFFGAFIAFSANETDLHKWLMNNPG